MDINITIAAEACKYSNHPRIVLFILYLCCNKLTRTLKQAAIYWRVIAERFIRDARYIAKEELRKFFGVKILTLN